MHLNSIRNIWTINIYFIILFLDRKSNAVKLDDLKLVCMHDFPFDYNFDHEPDSFCTAKGTYNTIPIPKDVDLNKLQGKKPYVFYFRKVVFTYSPEVGIKFEDVTTFYDEISNLMKGKNVDVLILDFTEKDAIIKQSMFTEVNLGIVDLITKIKNNNKGILVGLQLYRDYQRNTDYIPCIINESVDLYVVSTYNYYPCVYRYTQAEMAQPTSEQDLISTSESLKESGFDMKKMFFTIELLAKAWKNEDQLIYDSWTYSHMCGGTDPSQDRKYCIQSLKNLYNQAKQCKKLEIRGIFVKSADNDDWANNCHCGNYAGMNVIKAAFIDNKEDQKLTGCMNYGILERDHT